MKEVITEITLKMTHITQVPDEQVEEVVKSNADQEMQRNMANTMKDVLCLDDAVVTDVKQFVRDVKHDEE